MTDPLRFSDDADPALVLLLRAGQKEMPPRRALKKTIASLGAATTVIGVSQGAAAAAATKLGLWTLAKWAGAGVLSGVITVGGVELVQHGVESNSRRAVHEPASAAANAAETVRDPRQSVKSFPALLPPAPSPLPPPSPLPAASPATESARALPEHAQSAEIRVSSVAGRQQHDASGNKGTGQAEASSIRRSEPVLSEFDSTISVEIGLIDEARRALRAGRAASALEALDRHRIEVKRPRLAPEAQYLEMEALLAAGNSAAAQKAASALLERHPKGPHAARARAILGVRVEAR